MYDTRLTIPAYMCSAVCIFTFEYAIVVTGVLLVHCSGGVLLVGLHSLNLSATPCPRVCTLES